MSEKSCRPDMQTGVKQTGPEGGYEKNVYLCFYKNVL